MEEFEEFDIIQQLLLGPEPGYRHYWFDLEERATLEQMMNLMNKGRIAQTVVEEVQAVDVGLSAQNVIV